VNTQPVSNEARAIAYQTGVKALGPLVDRVINLERAVKELQTAAENAANQRNQEHELVPALGLNKAQTAQPRMDNVGSITVR
jgi:hypothetical protein